MKIAILVPTYFRYRWLAPFMAELLDEHWADHPPVFFCGLTESEGKELPLAETAEPASRESWSGFVLPAVRALANRGYDSCYLLLEEHLPLGICNAHCLNSELPREMEELGGSFISLMGWDNRRYLRRGTFVGKDHPGLLRLDVPQAPRFHLHPALWRLDVLQLCLINTLESGGCSAWEFEKVNEKWEAPLPEDWKKGCYQIKGLDRAIPDVGGVKRFLHLLECEIFHRLMSFYPLVSRVGGRVAGWMFWNLVGFDNFFYRGPYPMFFSGVMAKGGINSLCRKYLEKDPARRDLARRLALAREAFETKDYQRRLSEIA